MAENIISCLRHKDVAPRASFDVEEAPVDVLVGLASVACLPRKKVAPDYLALLSTEEGPVDVRVCLASAASAWLRADRPG